MINTKISKTYLNLLNLARTIIAAASLPIGLYLFKHADALDIFDSNHYLTTILQSLLPIILLINGIEELKKPNYKKSRVYMSFAGAFTMIVLIIVTYFRWESFQTYNTGYLKLF